LNEARQCSSRPVLTTDDNVNCKKPVRSVTGGLRVYRERIRRGTVVEIYDKKIIVELTADEERLLFSEVKNKDKIIERLRNDLDTALFEIKELKYKLTQQKQSKGREYQKPINTLAIAEQNHTEAEMESHIHRETKISEREQQKQKNNCLDNDIIVSRGDEAVEHLTDQNTRNLLTSR
jgi:hypothetical protein